MTKKIKLELTLDEFITLKSVLEVRKIQEKTIISQNPDLDYGRLDCLNELLKKIGDWYEK